MPGSLGHPLDLQVPHGLGELVLHVLLLVAVLVLLLAAVLGFVGRWDDVVEDRDDVLHPHTQEKQKKEAFSQKPTAQVQLSSWLL